MHQVRQEGSNPAISDKEVTADSVTVVDGPKFSASKTAKKKNKKSKTPTKIRPNNLGQFHASMRDALARNSDQTLHVVHKAFGAANLTMLDGEYPGLQPITAAEIEAPPQRHHQTLMEMMKVRMMVVGLEQG